MPSLVAAPHHGEPLPTVEKGYVPQSAARAGSAMATRFGATGLPFSVAFQNNEVLNRAAIGVFGMWPAQMLAARNFYEKLEVSWDNLVWLLLAMVGPIVLEKRINQGTEGAFRKKFAQYFSHKPEFQPTGSGRFNRWYHRLSNLGRTSPLRVPWGWLNGKPITITSANATQVHSVVRDVGFRSVADLRAALANPAFRNSVLKAKMKIVWLDVGIMAATNLISSWGRKLITAVLSGKQGFSGEFSYTTEAYQQEKSKNYQANKWKRVLISVLGVAGTAAVLPPLILAGAKSQGKTVVGRFMRKLNQAFDYNNSIFMSKWLTAWGGFATWMVSEGVSARDSHELRESLVKIGVLVATYTFGDDLVGGFIAKGLQKRAAKHGVSIVNRGAFGLPAAKRLSTVLNEVGQNVKHPAYRAARFAAWGGLVAATLLTGLTNPLVNNWYTRKKALAEQEEFAKRYLGLFQQPLLPVKAQ